MDEFTCCGIVGFYWSGRLRIEDDLIYGEVYVWEWPLVHYEIFHLFQLQLQMIYHARAFCILPTLIR